MKSECIKFLLDCYLNEVEQYDEVDGFVGDVHPQRFLETSSILTSNGNLSSEQELVVRQIASEMKKFSYTFEKSRQKKKLGIQFQKTFIFVPISDKRVAVQVVRKDNQTEAELKWKTIDKTAKSGLNFIGCEGEILFLATDKQKVIEIQLLDLEEDKEAHFEVELINVSECEVEATKKVNIFITNYKLQSDEKRTVENIFQQNHSSASVIKVLKECATARTFQTALQYLCGSTDSIPIQLTFACELTKAVISKTSKESLYDIVCNFFSSIPELEEVLSSFS